MMSPEDNSLVPAELLAQAVEILERIEDSNPEHAMGKTAMCFSAQQAAELALRAVVSHYDMPVPDTHDLGTLVEVLHPDVLRVPQQVQQARLLSNFASNAGATGQAEPATSDECRDAVTLAQNVVGWAQVILRAGKTL